jgi:hypothetical protein
MLAKKSYNEIVENLVTILGDDASRRVLPLGTSFTMRSSGSMTLSPSVSGPLPKLLLSYM